MNKEEAYKSYYFNKFLESIEIRNYFGYPMLIWAEGACKIEWDNILKDTKLHIYKDGIKRFMVKKELGELLGDYYRTFNFLDVTTYRVNEGGQFEGVRTHIDLIIKLK